MRIEVKMRIVVLDGYTENPGDLSWNGMKELGELRVYDRTSVTDPDEAIGRIKNAEAVITNKTPIGKEILDACPDIRYIGVLATGYNVVDCAYAAKKGIPVCNIPAYGTEAVAQFTIALLLEICHHIGDHSRAVHDGKWESSKDFCFWDYPLIELAGKNIGIIGYGRIGKETGRIARALGMNVLAYSRHRAEKGSEETAFLKAGFQYAGLDEIYAKSDVITLHCPLFPETKEMINKASISKMKDGVIILNDSRGGLINEEDLKEALDSGKVAAAGVDVVSSEPVRGDNPLLKARNCIMTPHIAWASKESRQRLMDTAVSNLKAFLDGSPVNIVNMQQKDVLAYVKE